MTSLFDPMTSASQSTSPTLDMLDGSIDTEKSSLHEPKGSDPTQVSPEPETVTVTVSTVGDEHGLVGQQTNSPFVADPNTIQFQYRPDNNGQNTGFEGNGQQIRVVHVQPSEAVGDRVDGAGTPTNFVTQAPQVHAQTVIQSPFSNGSSPTHHSDPDASTDANRFTYFHSQADASGAGNVVQSGTGEPMDSNNTYAVRSIPVTLQQPSSPSQLAGTITMAEAQTITTVGTAAGNI